MQKDNLAKREKRRIVADISEGIKLSRDILIVQKNDQETMKLKRHLEKIGCSVRVFQAINDAKGLLEKAPVDLLIVSAIISGGSAYEFCRWVRVKTKNKRIPIIVTSPIFTGTLQLEIKTKWGADEFVVLPSPINLVLRTIRFYLGEKVDRPDSNLSLKLAMQAQSQTTTTFLMKQKQKQKRKLPTEGNLSEVSLEKLLLTLAKAKRTGVLWIEDKGEEYSLSEVKGRVVRLLSPYIPDLTLASVLLKMKLMDQKQLDPFIEQMHQKNTKLGSLLFSKGLLKKKQVSKALNYQFMHKILGLFEKKNGIYRFKKKDVEPPEDFPVKLSIARVLVENSRRNFSQQQFEELYADKLKLFPRFSNKCQLKVKDLGIPKEQQTILEGFDGNHSLEEMLSISKIQPEKLRPIIHTMFQLKMLIT